MSKGKILVTDSLFIFPEHIKQMEEAGYSVERLDKMKPESEELKAALADKIGYILAGIESVTEDILDSANQLKAISIPAIGYPVFLPAWKYALDKGIKVSFTPEGPTHEVAEWAVMAALMMNRQAIKLGRVSKDAVFEVTPGIEGKNIGIVGLGRIGSRIVSLLKGFDPALIGYFSRDRKPEVESKLDLKYQGLADLLSGSDIVFICLADEAQGFIDMEQLTKMKQDALLVNITHPGIINPDALYNVLETGSIRAISDYPMDERFNDFSYDRWYCMNTSNTVSEAGAKVMSDMVTESMINLLEHGHDSLEITKFIK